MSYLCFSLHQWVSEHYSNNACGTSYTPSTPSQTLCIPQGGTSFPWWGDPHNTRGSTSPSSLFLQCSKATSWLYLADWSKTGAVRGGCNALQLFPFCWICIIMTRVDIRAPELEATKALSFYITIDHKYSYCSSSCGDVQLLNWGDCVIRSGSSFGWANYTGPIVERGVPLRLQLLQVSEASAALPSIWTIPLYCTRQTMLSFCFVHLGISRASDVCVFLENFI